MTIQTNLIYGSRRKSKLAKGPTVQRHHRLRTHENSQATCFTFKLPKSWTFLIIHKFHVTSSSQQQGVGDKINLKMVDGPESNFLPCTNNTLQLSPCKNKITFDLNLGRYNGLRFQSPPFYLHVLTDMLSVKFSTQVLTFIMGESGYNLVTGAS